MSNFNTIENVNRFYKDVNKTDKFLTENESLNILTSKWYAPYCINILIWKFQHPGISISKTDLIKDLTSLVSHGRSIDEFPPFVKDTDKPDEDIAKEIYNHLQRPGGTTHRYGWLVEDIDGQTKRTIVSLSDTGQDALSLYNSIKNARRILNSESTKSAIGKLERFIVAANPDKEQRIKYLEKEKENLKERQKEIDKELNVLKNGGTVTEESSEVLLDMIRSAYDEFDGVPEEISKLARDEKNQLLEIKQTAESSDKGTDNIVSRYIDGYSMRVYKGPNGLGYRTALDLLYTSFETDSLIDQLKEILRNNENNEIKDLVNLTVQKINACQKSIGQIQKVQSDGSSFVSRIISMQSSGRWRDEAKEIRRVERHLQKIYEAEENPDIAVPYDRKRKYFYPYTPIKEKAVPPAPLPLTEEVTISEEERELLKRSEKFKRSGSYKKLLSMCTENPVTEDDGRLNVAESFNASSETKLFQDICAIVEKYGDQRRELAKWIFETESGKKFILTMPNIFLTKEQIKKEIGAK